MRRARLMAAALLLIGSYVDAEVAAVEERPDWQWSQNPVAAGDARWTAGFWADRFQLCRDVVVPEMREAMEDQRNGACLGNFRVGAGLEAGRHRGTAWSDGDCYKWLEAQAWLFAVTRNSELDRQMDYWIDLIGKTQADDGYIGTQTQLNPQKERWAKREYHELYNHGHLMTAAAVHKQSTGKDAFVAIACKLADYLDRTFGPRPEHLAHYGWNPSNIMGLVDLYRVTGEQRYLDLAEIFVDMRGTVQWPSSQWGTTTNAIDPHPGDQNQNRVPLRKEILAVGHAVTGPYLWCGAADVVAETGDRELLTAMLRIWSDVVHRKMYVTGAIGAYHHGVSVRSDLVHEAFGRQYELPQRTAYNETCANISNAMWNRRLLQITGNPVHADVMERVLYNSALSPMSLDGKTFCYCNPLRRVQGVELLDHDTPRRLKTLSCYCCPPSVARTIAKSAWWAYGISNQAVWINLYGSSELDTTLPGGEALKLVQETDYPWSGKIRVCVAQAPETALSVKFRIPGWADAAASVAINGQAVPVEAEPGTYAAIHRVWQGGDVVTIDLPMRPVLIQSDPRVEETWGQAAVMRGPLVYCAESLDLPAEVSLWDVQLPRDATWTVKHDPDLLDGVTVLQTEAIAFSRSKPSGVLFQRVAEGDPQPIDLQLIPYFAWNNRAETEMSVWLPLR